MQTTAIAGQNARMGSLLVVTGPPGSGKSSVAKVLAQHASPSALVEGDQFFSFLARGAIEPWLAESHEQNAVVTAAAASATGRYVQGGYFTVYDGIVGPWFLHTFASATGVRELDYAVLMPSANTCVERVLNRTGHGFRDETATRKMHYEFSGSDVDQRFVIDVGSDTVDQVADRITVARASGLLAHRVPL